MRSSRSLTILFVAAQFLWASSAVTHAQTTRPTTGASTAKRPRAAAGAVTAVKTVDLPGAVSSSAISPTTGGVCVVSDKHDRATLYPHLSEGNVDEPVTIRAGADLGNVAHKLVGKTGYFLIPSARDQCVSLIDDRTGKIVKRIAIKAGSPRWIAAPASPSATFAYYSIADGVGIGRIDLAEPADTGLIDLDYRLKDSPYRDYHVWTSSAGEFIYAKGSATYPTGIIILRVPPRRAQTNTSENINTENQTPTEKLFYHP
jgi:hypothetical protein